MEFYEKIQILFFILMSPDMLGLYNLKKDVL